jgi:hypothetical protein
MIEFERKATQRIMIIIEIVRLYLRIASANAMNVRTLNRVS